MRGLRLRAKSGDCDFFINEPFKRLASRCGNGKVTIVTDRRVAALYRGMLKGTNTITIGVGERAKTLETVRGLYGSFLKAGLDRSSTVVGMGGGVVCDVTGFAASTYMRGMRFGFAPTTLLAQLDACAGGKNGVDFMGYKNLVGTIRQPGFCIIDFSFLETLPSSELAAGFAEAVKCGAISDQALFGYLERNASKALSLNRAALERVVCGALAVKIRTVELDEADSGERMKLNFGHTLGHAIEKAYGLKHGAAIGIGMAAAARLSVEMGMLGGAECQRLVRLLEDFGLPTELPRGAVRSKALLDAIGKDKKRLHQKARIVLLEGIGRSCVVGADAGNIGRLISLASAGARSSTP